MPGWWSVGAAALCFGLISRPASAAPEENGPYNFEVWQNPPGAPIPLPAGIIYPTDAPCPGAPVALVHGFGEGGDFKVRMGELVASYGLVAILPSYPSLLTNPSQAEADQLNATFEWIVAQSNDPSSPIAGLIDDTAYGVAGHSNGGVVYLAASDNPKIQAIIGWDAVAHLSAASGFHGPSLHLLADGFECGGGSRTGYDLAPGPKKLATVVDSSHCDYNDPASPFCVPVCGTPPWNEQAARMIERYSVAFFVCTLGHEPSMTDYLDFAAAPMGLSGTEQVDVVACQASCDDPGGTGDDGQDTGAGTSGDSAGESRGDPSDPSADDSGGPPNDAGEDSGAGSSDGGTGQGQEGAAGCGCRSDRAPTPFLALMLLLGLRRRE